MNDGLIDSQFVFFDKARECLRSYLSTLNVLANERNSSTIVFPFPMDLAD